jgi:mRNA guanylyltransferase
MPVNFSRHNLEEIQRSPDDAYFLSEKTDGVRYFMVFTCDTVVLVDRAMRGKQPIPSDPSQDPFASILPLVKPGTVLDGEVVMNRRSGRKPRPIFIVFDVLAISSTEPVLHLNFEERLKHLHKATFRQPNGSGDIFDPHFVADPKAPLPLVRKNFVKRTDVDELLSHVVEERGMRCYTYRSANGELHYHLTDGIIFQPNLPYVCGTDRNLLKWKYLDTVTIDIEIMPLLHTDEDDVFRVACLGEEGTRVDMSRYVMLPKSERMKLEADRFETGGRITEVGFDPEIGEFYYLTMREDKIAPNHISTVLGTLLELAESLTTDELRYRMSIPAGARDTYRKDMRGMIKQLLDHHRKNLRDFRRHHR